MYNAIMAGQSQLSCSLIMLDKCAKKVTSDSLGLVDFVLVLVAFILYLPNEQVKLFGQKFEKIQVAENFNF